MTTDTNKGLEGLSALQGSADPVAAPAYTQKLDKQGRA